MLESTGSILRRYLAHEVASEDYCDEVVDGSGHLLHIDSTGSVSGLEQERDFHAQQLETIRRACEEVHNG